MLHAMEGKDFRLMRGAKNGRAKVAYDGMGGLPKANGTEAER